MTLISQNDLPSQTAARNVTYTFTSTLLRIGHKQDERALSLVTNGTACLYCT